MTKVYVKTWGCSLNKADGEQMAGLLKKAGFKLIEDLEEADVVVLNSCTVKGPSENSLLRELEKLKTDFPYKIVVLAGCVSQADPEKFKGYPMVGTRQIDKIVEVVEEALNENVVCSLSGGENPQLGLPKIRENPIVEIVPICRGCLGKCTYCKTKAARGELISYPISEIKLQVRKALMQGVKEIWLTAQDCGCYGFDIGTNLAELLGELTSIDKNFKIRVGMINPNHLMRTRESKNRFPGVGKTESLPTIQDELLKAFKSEKVFKFLHLPVQSGNNEVLKIMGREYSVENFVGLVKEFRRFFPELTLATDVIVGFPGETEEHCWDTLNLVRKISPDILNISKFWSRPGTKAAKMKGKVAPEEIKRRSKVLVDIFNNISRMQNEKWIGWEGEIVIDERNEEKKNWVGRNFAYKLVVVEGEFNIGDKVKVRVYGLGQWDLRGKLV